MIDDIRHDLQTDGKEDAHELSYHMIVDARQFWDLASISILSHHCGGLSKRQSHRDVLNSQVKSQTVLDDDNIGSVFLQLKQLYGSGLCDGLGILCLSCSPLDGKKIHHDSINDRRPGYGKLQAILVTVHMKMNARPLLLVEKFYLVLMRQGLIQFSVVGMLSLQMGFVTLRTKGEPE
ncbi:hypothetical protein BASA61_002695 [Batrachochytrium salamandrivorans]|nr:hypothetical protein BASA61_002695 [Batrachochytrium salamandrivorans]